MCTRPRRVTVSFTPRGRHVARVRPHLAGDLLRLNQRGVAVAIREGIGTALRGGLALRHLRGFLRLERSLLRFLRGLGRGEEEEEEEEDGDGRRRGGVDRQSANGAASAVSGEGRDATGPRARSAPSSPPADRIDRTTEATRRRGGPSSQPSSRRRLRRRRRSPPAAPREGRRRTSSVMSGSRGGAGREERAARCARATDRSRRRTVFRVTRERVGQARSTEADDERRETFCTHHVRFTPTAASMILPTPPRCAMINTPLSRTPHAAAALAAHAWSPTPASSAAATFPLPPLAAAAGGAQKTLAAARHHPHRHRRVRRSPPLPVARDGRYRTVLMFMTRDVRVPAAPLRTRTPTDHLALVVRVSLARPAVLRVEGPYERTSGWS